MTILAVAPIFRHHRQMGVDWKAAGLRVRKAREELFPGRGGAARLAEKSRVDKGVLSKFESGGHASPSDKTVEALAKALNVTAVWIRTGEEPKHPPRQPPEMPAGTFLLQLRSRPGLERAIAKHPEKWTLATVAAAVDATYKSDSDGNPEGGWVKLLDELAGGGPEIVGGADELQRIAPKPAGLPPKTAGR